MPKKILIVDDDTDTLRLVGLMLERQGYEGITDSSGRQALSKGRDLGASLTPITVKTLPYCDELGVVVELVQQTIVQTKYLINDLFRTGVSGGKIQVVLIIRSRSNMEPSWVDVQELLGHPISTAFPPAPELTYQASLHNIPVVIQQPDGQTAGQYFNLAS